MDGDRLGSQARRGRSLGKKKCHRLLGRWLLTDEMLIGRDSQELLHVTESLFFWRKK